MSHFEKKHEFNDTTKRDALSNALAFTYSFTNLICLISFLTLFSGCIQSRGNINVTLANKKTAPLNISVANIQVINRQFIITGTNLSEVSSFQIKNGGSTTDLQIESKSNTSIVANTLSNVSFAVGTIFDFVLSNASAASTFQVTFTNSNNSITAPMLTSMSATKGQVMKYNGSAWVASSITNAQTYMGTWDALNNVPDLTIPSSMPGDYYIVSVAGPFRSVPYAVGDWIISDGYNWQKVANSAVVVSTFNGRRGIVTLVPGDYVSLKNGSGKVTGSSLNDLEDVHIATPLDGSVLKYNIATSKWIVGVDNAGGSAYTGTPSMGVVTDVSGALTTSSTTAAELNFVSGVTSSIQTQLGTKLGTALADGKIFVGNGSGVATAVSLSGDATLINSGAITLKNTGTAGTYTSVTTDAQGRVTSGSNPAVAAITALTGDVTASGTGSVAATIATSAVTTGKILDGTILPTDLNFTGINIGTSGLVIKNSTGGFFPLVCSTVGHVPTWTVVGFDCLPASLSSVTAALATNTIDNSTFAQVWNWSTATTQSLMTMAANALTTGSILNLTTSNATVNSTNGLLNVANTGASTSGMLARFQANSTAGSGMTMLTNGNVGIGTTTPAKALSVEGSIEYTVNVVAAGDVIATGYLAGSYMATSQISSIYSYSEGTPSTILIGDNEWINTTGTQNSVRIDPWMHPSSGSATFTGLNISPVVEQTGGANGITRGLYINAAIVAAADFRALEVTGGKSIFLGNVGIGTATPGFTLDVNGSIAAVGALQAHSDKRLKKNIVKVDNSLDKLLALNGVYFDWRKDEFPGIHFEGGRQLGVIAQDVEKVFPEAVAKNKDGIRSVAYTMLIAPLIEAVKELYTKIIGHDEAIASNERAIASVKTNALEANARIKKLENENSVKDKKIAELTSRLMRIEKMLSK
jgi:hypothetical protein